ncbi:hypothetical protein PG990_001035 [Apiospora arundinis]|uniref:2EXR domain-containing protein n=1 Tax=Apiospora arundinis TaxID=335852 RepID=A0ABR2I131_9PEZI
METPAIEQDSSPQLDEFHYYSRLPAELRRAIWLHFLEEERRTPRVYILHFRYPKRNLVATTESARRPPRPEDLHDHYQTKPGDRIIIQPFLWRQDLETGQLAADLSPLQAATAAWRAAAATCADSREVVLDVLPDVLPFQTLPYRWALRELPEDRADASDFSSYDLRFNGSKDVMMFHARWTDLEAIVRIAKMQGSGGPSHPCFATIRHLGLSTQGLLQGFASSAGEFERCYRNRECACDNGVLCPPDDACQFEPLPAFLSLFPQLRTLYLADAQPMAITPEKLKRAMMRLQGEHGVDEASRPLAKGKVFVTGWRGANGVDDAKPVFRTVDFLRESVVAYAEDNESCVQPSSMSSQDPKVHEIRREWRRVFPYYKSLQHLDIRFMAELKQEAQPVNHDVLTRGL